jgi:hypothetical protein
MELTIFGKNQSIEQHLREQIERYTASDGQGGVKLNDMGILLRASLALLQGQSKWIHDEETRLASALFLVWAQISETKETGLVETFEATIPVRAESADEARSKFDAYWAEKTHESGRIFTVINADVSKEIV